MGLSLSEDVLVICDDVFDYYKKAASGGLIPWLGCAGWDRHPYFLNSGKALACLCRPVYAFRNVIAIFKDCKGMGVFPITG